MDESSLNILEALEDCIKIAQKICVASMRLDFPAIRYLTAEMSNRLPYIPHMEKIAGDRENGRFIFDVEAAEFFQAYADKAYWELLKAYKCAFKGDMLECAGIAEKVNGYYGQGVSVAYKKFEQEFPPELRRKNLINPA